MTERLFQYKIKTAEAQQQIYGYYNSQKQFNVVPSGRRALKTETAKRRLVKRMLGAHDPKSPYYVSSRTANYFVACPTLAQTIRIYWKDMIALLKPFIKDYNKSQRTIELVNGATLFFLSGEAPERFEGMMWDGGILDEYGNMAEDVWTEHISECLADTGGYCDFIGVPEGRNHYYKLYNDAKETPEYWDTWHWLSKDVLADHIIEQYKKMLDEKTFRQEMEGSFESYQGRAYYPFDHALHLHRVVYKKDTPLFIQFDFNTAPGVATFSQECQKGQVLTLPDFTGTGCVGEVYINKGSNTELVCGKVIQLFRQHEGIFIIDGDATGGAHKTSSDRSDWEIVIQMFKIAFPNRVHFKVPPSNPFERDRINAVNSRLKNIKGEVSLVIDPDKCPRLVEDFDNTSLNDKGELDKPAGHKYSHMTDALGYYISRVFPVIRYVNPQMTHWK